MMKINQQNFAGRNEKKTQRISATATMNGEAEEEQEKTIRLQQFETTYRFERKMRIFGNYLP